jgi:plastocyanin
MKRAALLAAVAALGAAGDAALAAAREARLGTAGEARLAAPARLLVEAREFNLTLSRGTVKHGGAIVQLANQGEDPHDLAIKRVGGKRRGAITETRPGELGEWVGRLRRGRYRLYCTLEGHRAAGMRAVLRVR